ncbi:MAG: hypothetical protein AB8H86_24460 [Polyangiales bacterium]
MLKRALATVPELHRRHIEVEPFVYVHDGIEFGLIPQAPEDEGGSWTVNAMPGDYMCLLPPWDGTYDT